MESHLYAMISEPELRELLKTFYVCIGLPIQVIDTEGNILQRQGGLNSFCKMLKPFLPADDFCDQYHLNAGKKAIAIGDSYVFTCHANLNHITYPLVNKGVFFGSVLVGPFLMEEADSILLTDLERKYSIPTTPLLEIYDSCREIPIFPPEKINSISKLLFYLFSGLIGENQLILRNNQGKLSQQSQINESIQKYKSYQLVQYPYPLEKEKELISKVRTGNAAEAKAILNDLLGYVLFSEGAELDNIKIRAVELCSLLSRAAMEGSGSANSIFQMSDTLLTQIQESASIDQLCFRLQEAVEEFSENAFRISSSKNSDLIKKAINYISKNYSTSISLDSVAGYVHLNPAYFSTVFKQVTGQTFKEYLNMIRIEESKRLLANTDYSIINIAVASGFDNQSYFSKVFKRYTGLTPKQYRA